MPSRSCGLLALILLPLALQPLTGDEAPKPAAAGTLVVVDAKGKEHKVAKYTFSNGTTSLNWAAGKEDKAPEALVIRDAMNIAFRDGVVAYVPLDRIRVISFDNQKQTMSVRVATSKDADEDVTLTGTTRFKAINKVTIKADVDRGEEGIASLTFQGGVTNGIQAIRFPAPKLPAAGKPGRPAVVQSVDKSYKRTDKVHDLQPLYRVDRASKLAPTLFFKKTLKLDVAKLKKITAGEMEGSETIWTVTRKDDEESALSLLKAATLDGKQATLLGLVGKVPTGYRFFTLDEITAIHFDTSEVPGEKKKEKEKIKADTE